MTVNGLEGSILFGPNWSGKVGNCIVWGSVLWYGMGCH